MPIPPDVFLSFLGVTLLVVLSPGPDTMLILRYSFGAGQGVGLAAVGGVQLGLLLHTVAIAFGLSLVVAASPDLLRGVAFLGALYLGWLGLQLFREDAIRGLGLAATGETGAMKACRDGALTNLLNPKVILLFVALLPQFVSPDRGSVPLQFAILGAAIIVLSAVWQVALVLGAESARRLIGRPAVQRIVNRTTAVVFIAFASLMVYEHVV